MSADLYQQLALDAQHSALPWVYALQQQGVQDFQRLGFPDRRNEDWRYTSVADFLKHDFRATPSTPELSLAALAVGHQADIPLGHKVTFVDGMVLGVDALRAVLPPGVIVQTLNTACLEHPEKIAPYLGQLLETTQGFHAQNTAMLHLGLFIYVPARVQLLDPILIVHWQTKAGQACYLRHLVVAEEGAGLTVIEDYQGSADTCYYTNTVTELYAAPEASVVHYKMQRESNLAYHVGHLAICQKAASLVNSHVWSFGGRWSRSDICNHLIESKANCVLNGVYALRAAQHMDHHTWLYHRAPLCSSQQDYKGILAGKSRAVFNGQVHVAPQAQQTVAKQQNKNLLLSAQAEIDTKPQLDIAADDVSCTHGATVGQLDDEALFYFATRGIDLATARGYLVRAFALDNLRAIRDEALAAWMGNFLENHLGFFYE